MHEVIQFIISSLALLFGVWFVYMSAHVQEEQRQGKYIRLPWERKQDNGE
jgi:hypothetical protein